MILSEKNIDIKHFPYTYNMMEMSKKEIIDTDFLFTKLGWVYHFNSDLPKLTAESEDLFWMRETYKYLYNDIK